MVLDNNLEFIREKIYDIRSAIMYSMSNELVRIPNSIVNAVNVDDEGYVWFICKRPAHSIDQCEQEFPARLVFYKKGRGSHIEVTGKAIVVNNEYTNYFAADANGDTPLLLKMCMQAVEYSEPQEKKKTKMENWIQTGYQWFLRTAAVSHDAKPDLSRLNHV